MSGRLTNIFLKEIHGQPMRPVEEATAVDGQGLVGDASYGRGSRQALFIELETLAEFGLAPGEVRENFTVSGITLAGLPKGSQLQVGESIFEVTGDCTPCQFIEDMQPGLRSAIRGRRGTLGRVLIGGQIRPGDPVKILDEASA